MQIGGRQKIEPAGFQFGRFQAEVFGLCVRLLHHRHDAEDVTQEVFLRVFRSLHRWDSARPLKTWVMGIAVNRCRTWLSQRSRRPELVDYLQDTAPDRPADDSRWEVFTLAPEPGYVAAIAVDTAGTTPG